MKAAQKKLPHTTGVGRRKPASVVSSAPQRKPTRPSSVEPKKPDVSEEIDSQSSGLKRKDPPPVS